MEIVVLDKHSDKLIRMEVQPKHTIGSIIETIVDKQKLDRSQRYKLTLGNRAFAREQYLLKVKDAGLTQGDHLFLEPELPLQPSVVAAKTEVGLEQHAVTPTPAPPPAHIESAPVAPRPPEAPPMAKPPAGYTPKFCLQCGEPLRAGSKFCLDCGTPVRRR